MYKEKIAFLPTALEFDSDGPALVSDKETRMLLALLEHLKDDLDNKDEPTKQGKMLLSGVYDATSRR